MKRRIVGECLSIVGLIVILSSTTDGLFFFFLLGITMTGAAVWFRNRVTFRKPNKYEKETSLQGYTVEAMWPRWFVSSCAGVLLLVMSMPGYFQLDREEEYLLVFMICICPVAIAVLLSALGLFGVSLIIGLWLTCVLFGMGAYLSTILACPLWIVPLFLCIQSVIRVSRRNSSESSQT